MESEVLETTGYIGDLDLIRLMGINDLPGLQEILNLLREIENVLGSSDVELLSLNVQSTHNFICDLINRTRDLLQRGRSLEDQLRSSTNTSEMLLSNLEVVMGTLSELEDELSNVSASFDSIRQSMNSSSYLRRSRSALELADDVERLVRNNFNLTLSEVRSILLAFDLLNATKVEERSLQLSSRVDSVQSRIDDLRGFINDVNLMLCGTGIFDTGSGDDAPICEGVSYGTCGAGGECDSLANNALKALNTSIVTLDRAYTLLNVTQNRLDALRNLVLEAQRIANASDNLADSAENVMTRTDVLQLDIEDLVSDVEGELNVTRVDPEEIGRNVNDTLALKLELMPEQVKIGGGGLHNYFSNKTIPLIARIIIQL